MPRDAVVFACANPVPEIWPWEAKEAGARVVATGRSDFPNQQAEGVARVAKSRAEIHDAASCVPGSSPSRPRERDEMALFTVGEEVNHQVGDLQCPECWEEYPEPCRCGGLMHAAGGWEEDADGNILLTTCCDQCGRSEDQLDEV